MGSYLRTVDGQEFAVGKHSSPTECFRCGICCVEYQPGLDVEEAELMARLFAYSPLLKEAYELREELTAIFEKNLSKEEATTEIKVWQKKVEKSTVSCFNKFLNTLDNHLDGITNYFVNRDSSGFVEGFNNKIKVLKRRCYGILNLTHFFQRLVIDLEGYRLFLPDLVGL